MKDVIAAAVIMTIAALLIEAMSGDAVKATLNLIVMLLILVSMKLNRMGL